jgi:hypothetical protein
MATPHATGTVALLMSYLDSTASVYKNLAPEDAEQLLIRNTFNAPSGGRNDSVGYGDLNAGRVLQDVNKGCKELVHFGRSNINNSSLALIKLYTPIKLTEKYTNPLNGLTYDTLYHDSIPYLCDIYKAVAVMSTSINSNYTITESWTRPSSSSLMLFYDSTSHTLQPFEHLYIDSISTHSAGISGFFYILMSPLDSSLVGFIGAPDSSVLVNSDSINLLGFEYTVVLKNTSVSCYPVDTTTTNIKEIQNQTIVSFYPNPVSDMGELVISTDKENHASIDIMAIEGQNIETVFSGALSSGNTNFPIDASKLSSGVYMIVVNIGGQRNTIKFSKYE